MSPLVSLCPSPVCSLACSVLLLSPVGSPSVRLLSLRPDDDTRTRKRQAKRAQGKPKSTQTHPRRAAQKEKVQPMTNHTHQQHTHRLHAHDTNTNNNTNNTTNHRRPMSDCLHTMAMCSRSSHQNASVRRARRSGAFQVSFTLSFSSLILLLLLQLLTPSSPSSSSSSSLLFVSGLDSDELAAARAGLYSIHIATAPAATQLIRQTTAAYELEQTFDAHTEPMSSTSALLPAHLSGQYDLTVGQCPSTHQTVEKRCQLVIRFHSCTLTHFTLSWAVLCVLFSYFCPLFFPTPSDPTALLLPSHR